MNANITPKHKSILKLARRAKLYWGIAALVAKTLGVSQPHVSMVIHGKRRSPRVEAALAREVRIIERNIGDIGK